MRDETKQKASVWVLVGVLFFLGYGVACFASDAIDATYDVVMMR